jgi:hypothetical protein
VLSYASGAGERAAALGAHREAAAQFARALRFAERLGSEQRAWLLERRSYECYPTNAIDDSIHARRQALIERRRQGDRLREGDSHRWLSRLLRYAGASAEGRLEARRAVELLESLPPGPELAMAYSNMSQLAMVANESASASVWGERARDLAERLDETEILVHALNNLGSAEVSAGSMGGREKLRVSLALAEEAGLEEHVARAHSNLAAVGVAIARLRARGSAHRSRDRVLLRAGSRLDVPGHKGWQARSALDQGQWEQAAECAAVALSHPGARILPLVVLGRLRARRGDPEPWAPLDEAAALAHRSGEVQRIAPVAAARAEARRLEGENQLVAAETDDALAPACATARSPSAWCSPAEQSSTTSPPS